MKTRIKTHVIKHVSLVLAIIVAHSAIVMLLWNLLIPAIFGLASINFWQALGLSVLARLLFGGNAGRFLMGFWGHSHHNGIRERWMKMTSEERKEFIRDRHHRHCHRSDFFDTKETEKDA